jgi:flagellar assembly factor FliW
MPRFATKNFGIVDYELDAVIEFPAGLPGFEQETRFVALEQPATKPLVFLQSLSRPDLCFITMPVRAADPLYRLSVTPEDLRYLELPVSRQPEIGTEVLCLAIISVAEGRSPTANLLAPLVVNLRSRRAVQAIAHESGYSHQHALTGAPQEEPCSSFAGAPGSRS